MEAVCKKEDIAKVLDIAVRVASKNSTLPILSTIRIEAKAGVLELRATNLEIGLIAEVPSTITTEGVVAVPAQILLQTISLISYPSLTLKTEGDILSIITDRSRSKLKTLPIDDFPTITSVSATPAAIDGKLLSLGIKSVVFAASQSSIKPELGAVYIHQKKQHTLTFVATDSFRLAEKTISANGVVLEHGLLIPQKNALEIARTIDVVNEQPTISFTTNQISVSFPSRIQLISRLIEGTFPDYEQIIPKEYQTHCTLLLKDLEHALRKTNIFTNKFMQVTLALDQDAGTITLASENTESGTTEEEIRADIEGVGLKLSFNQHYLTDALPHTPSDSLLASFGGIGRPLVITPHGDTTFRYLVMPMNK